MRHVEWRSPLCTCHGYMAVDSEEHRYHIHACDADHVLWSKVVGLEVLNRKLAEMSKPWPSDIAKMRELLVWVRSGDVFMRPTFAQANNGLTAYQCFWDWESKGVSLPAALEDSEVLADLVQAKRCREFQIDLWVTTWKMFNEYPIWPEEQCDHPGMTLSLFKKIYGRAPNQFILASTGEPSV